MLKLGAQEVSALYLGETKISRAYLGEKLVFEGSKPSRLPEGYTEVEYIERTNGVQYFNGGYPISLQKKYVIKAKIESYSTKGSRRIFDGTFLRKYGTTYYSLGISIGTNQNSNLYCTLIFDNTDANTCRVVFSPEVYLNKDIFIEFDIKNKVVLLNGEKHPISYNATSFLQTPTPKIMGNNNSTDEFTWRMYFYEEYDNDELVSSFVPCIAPSGIVGAYDIIRNQFEASAGTGTFIAGPPV